MHISQRSCASLRAARLASLPALLLHNGYIRCAHPDLDRARTEPPRARLHTYAALPRPYLPIPNRSAFQSSARQHAVWPPVLHWLVPDLRSSERISSSRAPCPPSYWRRLAVLSHSRHRLRISESTLERETESRERGRRVLVSLSRARAHVCIRSSIFIHPLTQRLSRLRFLRKIGEDDPRRPHLLSTRRPRLHKLIPSDMRAAVGDLHFLDRRDLSCVRCAPSTAFRVAVTYGGGRPLGLVSRARAYTSLHASSSSR
jgi:hypothetical protein